VNSAVTSGRLPIIAHRPLPQRGGVARMTVAAWAERPSGAAVLGVLAGLEDEIVDRVCAIRVNGFDRRGLGKDPTCS